MNTRLMIHTTNTQITIMLTIIIITTKITAISMVQSVDTLQKSTMATLTTFMMGTGIISLMAIPTTVKAPRKARVKKADS
ncbi:MAG: hypothetical protein HRT45_06215 [Bdellovibrionales bacterium]|nr:hypothetical protein [Bdellovibrionales bacterium]